MLTQLCKKCREILPASDFIKVPGNRSGFSGTCTPCRNKKRREDYKASEYRKQKNLEYARQNPEKLREYSLTYYYKNWDECRKKRKDWYKKNPGKVTAMRAKRRAAELQAIPPWANLEVIKNFYTEAKQLAKIYKVPYEVDHIVPLRGKNVCGLHVENNLRVITKKENMLKKNLLIEELIEERLNEQVSP